jgi:hypothetical protein
MASIQTYWGIAEAARRIITVPIEQPQIAGGIDSGNCRCARAACFLLQAAKTEIAI